MDQVLPLLALVLLWLPAAYFIALIFGRMEDKKPVEDSTWRRSTDPRE
jgi:hypothetical protein